MKISLIGPYIEYGNPEGCSLKDHFVPCEYPGQKEAVQYLKSGGKELGISMRIPVDFFTGERLPGVGSVFYADDKYSWNGTLAYYVERYNLKLPDAFIRHVLSK